MLNYRQCCCQKTNNFSAFVYLVLKRVCHKSFYLYFFQVSNTSGTLINRPKYFRFRQIFLKNSVVCFLSWRKTLRCLSHHRVRLHGMCITPLSLTHTAESSSQQFTKNSAVCITPLSQTAHLGVKVENVNLKKY